MNINNASNPVGVLAQTPGVLFLLIQQEQVEPGESTRQVLRKPIQQRTRSPGN